MQKYFGQKEKSMTPEEKKYIDAKTDLLKALKSIGDLTPQQQEQLAKELLGAEWLGFYITW